MAWKFYEEIIEQQIAQQNKENFWAEIEAIKAENEPKIDFEKESPISAAIGTIIVWGIFVLLICGVVYVGLSVGQMIFGNLPPMPWYISILFLLILFKR